MRKLAAIMFTDIKGFTTMMQQDEAKAMKTLSLHKELFLQFTKQYEGEVIKFIGDGTLTIFTSANQAVRCAIALQEAFLQSGILPVRIGVHMGEVIVQDSDVIGDSVNLASRIQSAGIVGGVVISEKVRDEIRNQSDFLVTDIGSFNLKNVLKPLRLFAVNLPGLTMPLRQSIDKNNGNSADGKHHNLPITTNKIMVVAISLFIIGIGGVKVFRHFVPFKTNKTQFIAVVTFQNIDTSKQDQYRADGITDDLIKLLNVVPAFNVVKIPADRVDNKKEAMLGSIASETTAENILNGTIKHKGDSVVVTAHLKNINNGKLLWSKTYGENDTSLTKIQLQMVMAIAAVLDCEVDKAELEKFAEKRGRNPDAVDLYKKGRSAQAKRSKVDMEEAYYYFTEAIKLDSNYALAYTGISDNFVIQVDNELLPYDSGEPQAKKAIDRAFAIDSTLAEVRASKGIYLITLEGDREQGKLELSRAIKLSPGYVPARQWYSVELAADKRFNAALAQIDTALKAEPYTLRIWEIKGLILMFAERYSEVITVTDKMYDRFSKGDQSMDLYYSRKALAYYHLGKSDSALLYAKQITKTLFDYSFWSAVVKKDNSALQHDFKTKTYQRQSRHQSTSNEELSKFYIFLQQPDSCINYMKKAFEKKEFTWLKFLNVNPDWAPLKNSAGFNEILGKLGF